MHVNINNSTFAISWQRFFSKPTANLALRITFMFAGLICIALGIALAKLATMGTSPISSVPAVMTEVSEHFGIPMTMGMWTFVFNLSYFLLELALLRRAFKPVQFLQIPLFFVLSVFVDVWLGVFGPMAPRGLCAAARLAACLHLRARIRHQGAACLGFAHDAG